MAQPVFQFTVLNTIQAAAADITLAQGNLSVTDLGRAIKLSDGISYTVSPYAVGTAAEWQATFPATPVPSTSYFITLELPNHLAFPNGGQNSNQLSRIRTYTVYTATSGETGTTLADKFEALINADLWDGVIRFTSTNQTTPASNILAITQAAASVTALDGIPVVTATSTVTLNNTIPGVFPSGTPSQLIAAGIPTVSVSQTAEYSTYDLVLRYTTTRGVANGARAFIEARAVIYADELQGDFAAFDTEIISILDGSHTPVADFLGFGM
jgi:hypothetical protein